MSHFGDNHPPVSFRLQQICFITIWCDWLQDYSFQCLLDVHIRQRCDTWKRYGVAKRTYICHLSRRNSLETVDISFLRIFAFRWCISMVSVYIYYVCWRASKSLTLIELCMWLWPPLVAISGDSPSDRMRPKLWNNHSPQFVDVVSDKQHLGG